MNQQKLGETVNMFKMEKRGWVKTEAWKRSENMHFWRENGNNINQKTIYPTTLRKKKRQNSWNQIKFWGVKTRYEKSIRN